VWAGDVAFRVVDAIQKAEQRVRGDRLSDADEEDPTRVYVCDINPNMLEVGKKRAKGRGDLHVIAICLSLVCIVQGKLSLKSMSLNAFGQHYQILSHRVCSYGDSEVMNYRAVILSYSPSTLSKTCKTIFCHK